MLAKVEGTRPPSDRYANRHRKEGVAPTTFFRIREHGIRLAVDPRLTTVLGQMGLFNELSAGEVDAGFRIAEIYGRFERLTGAPRRAAASPSYDRGFGQGGKDVDEERRQKQERRARKEFDKLQLMMPSDWARDVLEAVCVDNVRPVTWMDKRSLPLLLHSFAVKWSIIPPDPKKVTAKNDPKDDGSLIAQAAVDAAEHWFANQFATEPIGFGFVDNPDWKQSRAFVTTDGQYRNVIAVPLRGLPGKAVDAQLRLYCAAKGWPEIDVETGEMA